MLLIDRVIESALNRSQDMCRIGMIAVVKDFRAGDAIARAGV